ncbi:MAG TPA: hypothetical protein VKV25_09700, partial [Acidimicrobiales bacterium]|nr:hypothetical protein [Acidimicrobiales bacterium]
ASSAVMVGLGPAEVGELNARARAVLRAAGVLHGPDAVVGGRPFAAGDRVLPLSRAVAPPGAEGRVVAVDPTAGRLEVAWGPRRAELDHWAARRLGHAYAVTPPGLGLRAGPVLLLGDPAALGRHAARVVRAASVARAAPSLEATVGRARSRGAGLGW